MENSISYRISAFATIVYLILTGTPLFADHHGTSTKEEFQEFATLIEGRWLVDVKFIHDWPGQKYKKGDEVTGYSIYSRTQDGHALVGQSYSGTGTEQITFAWDRVSKQIKFMHVTSGGLVTTGITWKTSKGIFPWKSTSGSIMGHGEHRFSDDGKTMTRVGSDLKMEGEEIDDLKDVYHRISNAVAKE